MKIQILVVPMNHYLNEIGIHILDPDDFEIEQAKRRALALGFDTIWYHCSNVYVLDEYRKKKVA